jgi:prophage maintenance system killer protein
MSSEIIIYNSPNGETQIDVQFEGETFWLNLNQISKLYNKDKSVISRHLTNIYKEGELERNSTVAKFATVQLESKREIVRTLDFFNLDVILSVGYRVNSKQGTLFRQWATQRLRDYLIKGYALNEKRLNQKNKEIQILQDGIRILSRVIEEKVSENESYDWLNYFSLGLQLLDDYDKESLDKNGNHFCKTNYPTKNDYFNLINQMQKDVNSEIFGRIKDGGFDSAINQIQQSFGDSDVYASIEEKAAMLLYLVVKNHAFTDGNKRIAAASFLLFLKQNQLLFSAGNKSIISNEALAGLTLFIAVSKADEMETVKKLLVSILNRNMN